MPTVVRWAVAQMLVWGIALANATVAAQPPTAEQCRRQYAKDRAAQMKCARVAFVTSGSQAQPAPRLVSPLANAQVIFGFFDCRFPGFNNGLEHLGVDYAAKAGAAVAAICDGMVVFNNTSPADIVSAVVMIEHECEQPLGKVYGYYGHVQSDLIPGDFLSAGSIIGTVRDWAGNSHLHLGMSTAMHKDDWGLAPRGATLQAIEAQGWLNPLNFFAGAPPARAARGVAPKAGAKAAAGKVKRKP